MALSSDVIRLIRATVERYGQLDILVNNAAKGEVIALTRQLAIDYAAEQIRVIASVPVASTLRWPGRGGVRSSWRRK